MFYPLSPSLDVVANVKVVGLDSMDVEVCEVCQENAAKLKVAEAVLKYNWQDIVVIDLGSIVSCNSVLTSTMLLGI